MMDLRFFLTTSPAMLLAGCTGHAAGRSGPRLQFRPPEPSSQFYDPGAHALELRKNRDPQLYVPKKASASNDPLPLLVYLHGAGGSEQQGIKRFASFAEEFGLLLLSPASRGSTWDAIQGSYGADVSDLDEALAKTCKSCRADPKRIALCGFSDGASYALGVGGSNGDVFQSIIAFSPGFIPAGFNTTPAKPEIFISHGTNDQILPIDSCSRRIVPSLKRGGYGVTFREFDGPHTVPREITEEALRWFVDPSKSKV